MRWRFDCFVCGERWELEHRNIEEHNFMFSEKKEGRPMVDCYRCEMDGVYVPLMGDMVGNRA